MFARFASSVVALGAASVALKPQPKVGVIRLDYKYPQQPGNVATPESFGFPVTYRVVPGLTFEMCQDNSMTPAITQAFKEAVRWLVEEEKVSGISGDCGFMYWFQGLAREQVSKMGATVPVFMSPLAQLPGLTKTLAKEETIIIMTSGGAKLELMREHIRAEAGVTGPAKRFHIVDLKVIPGFEAVTYGYAVDQEAVGPGIVALAQKALKEVPEARAFLFECTEIPFVSNAVRSATGLPVYDGITNVEFYMSGFLSSSRFGVQNWQEEFNGTHSTYEFGQELTPAEKKNLVWAPGAFSEADNEAAHKLEADDKAKKSTAEHV